VLTSFLSTFKQGENMIDAPLTQGMQVAALRGKQGSRTLYQVMVENSVLNNFFKIDFETSAEHSQRNLRPEHAKKIADYILENPNDYVLGALIYAVDTECIFTPSAISPDLGVLTIPFGTNMRSLDGQHRRSGLNSAIEKNNGFSKDHTSVLIYVEPEVKKRRQMFSDMNATPLVVAKALNVKFDSRDPFARAAQHLVATHSMLADTTDTENARVKGTDDKWYSLGAIFDALKRLQVGAGGRVRNASDYAEASIIARGAEFFDLLDAARPEFEELRAGYITASELRSNSILLSSTTLRAIAGAIHLRLLEDGLQTPLSKYVAALAGMDFTPTAWEASGFVSPGKSTPNARNQEVIAASKAIAKALS
jgi:DGQHR domain-containing protein